MTIAFEAEIKMPHQLGKVMGITADSGDLRCDMMNMIQLLGEAIRDDHKAKGLPIPTTHKAEVDAARRIAVWYTTAAEDEEAVRAQGLVAFQASHMPSRVWAALMGLKAIGVESLPL